MATPSVPRPQLYGVIFLLHNAPYNAGNRAGFPREIALKFILEGVAKADSTWEDEAREALRMDLIAGGIDEDSAKALAALNVTRGQAFENLHAFHRWHPDVPTEAQRRDRREAEARLTMQLAADEAALQQATEKAQALRDRVTRRLNEAGMPEEYRAGFFALLVEREHTDESLTDEALEEALVSYHASVTASEAPAGDNPEAPAPAGEETTDVKPDAQKGGKPQVTKPTVPPVKK